MKCNICKNEWMGNPQHLLRGRGCPKCGIANRTKHHRTHDEFVKEIRALCDTIEITSTYRRASEKVSCRCKVCGHEWYAFPYNLLSGYFCPICGYERTKIKQRYSKEYAVSRIYNSDPNILVIGDYINSKAPIKCRCLICGYEWYANLANLTNKHNHGTGCPHCKSSHGEKIVAKWLDSHNITYFRQQKFSDLIGTGGGRLSYDFYIPHINMLIEYQGEFHDGTTHIQSRDEFEKQKEHDKLKMDYANKNNINLLYIWYYDIDNIDKILNRNILLYNKIP